MTKKPTTTSHYIPLSIDQMPNLMNQATFIITTPTYANTFLSIRPVIHTKATQNNAKIINYSQQRVT